MSDEGQVSIQNALPLFEGEEVNREVVRLKGEFEQPFGSDPLPRRAERFAVIRFYVDEVNHKPDQDGWLERRSTAKITSAVIVDATAGKELQRHWQEEHRRRIHERNAQRTQEGLQTELLGAGLEGPLEGHEVPPDGTWSPEISGDVERILRAVPTDGVIEEAKQDAGVEIACTNCGEIATMPWTDDSRTRVDITGMTAWEVFDGNTLCPSCAETWLDRD
jgi:hypothetical protein